MFRCVLVQDMNLAWRRKVLEMGTRSQRSEINGKSAGHTSECSW